jgi:hypothetical protein
MVRPIIDLRPKKRRGLWPKDEKPTRPGVYNRVPRGYVILDPARSMTQARALVRAHRGNYTDPAIVRTGTTKGPNKVVFPYHIAVREDEYRRGGRRR